MQKCNCTYSQLAGSSLFTPTYCLLLHSFLLSARVEIYWIAISLANAHTQRKVQNKSRKRREDELILLPGLAARNRMPFRINTRLS
jgi:hypothetical protein